VLAAAAAQELGPEALIGGDARGVIGDFDVAAEDGVLAGVGGGADPHQLDARDGAVSRDETGAAEERRAESTFGELGERLDARVVEAVIEGDEGGALRQRAFAQAPEKLERRQRAKTRGDEIEDAAELAEGHEEVVADPAQHRRADVVEREHEALILADQAPGGEAGRERPERGSEEPFDATAKWSREHISRSWRKPNRAGGPQEGGGILGGRYPAATKGRRRMPPSRVRSGTDDKPSIPDQRRATDDPES
jgi:hypothetical protein